MEGPDGEERRVKGAAAGPGTPCALLRLEKRLARVLLLLASFGKEGKPEAVIPKISQEALAEVSNIDQTAPRTLDTLL